MARLQIIFATLCVVSLVECLRYNSVDIDKLNAFLGNTTVRDGKQIYFPRIRNFLKRFMGKNVEAEPGKEAPINTSRKRTKKRGQVRYDGAQLWQVGPIRENNEYALQVLEEVFGASVWRSNDRQSDVFVEKSAVNSATKFMDQTNLDYAVLIDDVQQLIDNEEGRFRSVVAMNWNDYHDFKVIENFLQETAKRHSRITELHVIGHTYEGRPLYVLRIGNLHKDNTAVWVDGGTHAREWITQAAVTFMINQLVEYWHDFPEHVRRRDWYIMPVANPDGYEYSRHFDRLWRKNRRNLGRGCYGVDLNRNFDFEWGDEDIDSDPCSDVYRGDEPLSELETQAITNFTLNLDPRPSAFLTYHSYGQLIAYPWAYKIAVPQDHEELKETADKAVAVIKKVTGSKYSTFPAHQISGPTYGGADDWAKAILGVDYSYTIELGDTGLYGFLLPAKFIRVVSTEAMIIARVVSQMLG